MGGRESANNEERIKQLFKGYKATLEGIEGIFLVSREGLFVTGLSEQESYLDINFSSSVAMIFALQEKIEGIIGDPESEISLMQYEDGNIFVTGCGLDDILAIVTNEDVYYDSIKSTIGKLVLQTISILH